MAWTNYVCWKLESFVVLAVGRWSFFPSKIPMEASSMLLVLERSIKNTLLSCRVVLKSRGIPSSGEVVGLTKTWL